MPDNDPGDNLRNCIDQRIAALKESISSGFAARDEAVRLMHDDMVRVPTLLDRAQQTISEYFSAKLAAAIDQINEKFRAVDIRFSEMEKRTKDLDNARALALGAAFQAAKDAVAEQNRSNTMAISKSELAVGDSLKQLQVNFQASFRLITEKIDDVKSRLDRGEGGTRGARQGRDEWRLNIGMVVGLLALIIAVGTDISVLVVALHH